MKDLIATVKENTKIAEGIYKLTFTLPESAGKIHGGQFVNISVGDSSLLLRRPLGVCMVDGNDITVCYQVKGKGTKRLTEAVTGEKLSVLLPLGNGFNLEGYKNVVVIGGGVGVFPLVATIREHAKKINFYTYAGFRNKSAVCLLNELERSKTLKVTTDDGSYGIKSNAVSAYIEEAESVSADAIIACGPPIMLKILKQQLEEKKIEIPCFVSLEERMGCGIGACLVCVCKDYLGANRRVCKDGPVFDIKEVNL